MRKQRDITWLLGCGASLFGTLILGLVICKLFTGTTPQLQTQQGISISLVPADMSVGAFVGQGLAAILSLGVAFVCLRAK